MQTTYPTKTLHLEYIKNFHNSTAEKNNPIRKWTKDINRYFTKEETANKYKKRCSTSFVIREMSIKTTIRISLHLNRH